MKNQSARKQQDTPIRVLHLRASPFLGSPEKLILGRLRTMNKGYCQYLIGIFDEQHGKENDFSKSAKKLNCDPIMLHDSMCWFFLNLIKIYKTILHNDIQIICTHDYKSNFYGLLGGKLLRMPIISVFHGRTGADLKVRFYERLDDAILRYFDAIICVSELSAKKLSITKNNSRVFVISNAVDIEEIEDLCSSNNGELDIHKKDNEKLAVYAGRLSKEKGLFYFTGAAKILLSNRKDIKFVILGDGSERKKLQKIIKDNQLSEFVHLLGFRNNIYRYFKSMDFLVLPSITEGMPLVILEAFALGKPVIATNVGGIPEVVLNGFNGILVNPKDVRALAQSIESLIVNPERASEMGQNGYAFVKENHTFETQTQKYLSVYKEVLRRRF